MINDWDVIRVNSKIRLVMSKYGKNIYEILDKNEAWRLYKLFQTDKDDKVYDGAFSTPLRCIYGINNPCIITNDLLPQDLDFVSIRVCPIWEIYSPIERYGRSILRA